MCLKNISKYTVLFKCVEFQKQCICEKLRQSYVLFYFLKFVYLYGKLAGRVRERESLHVLVHPAKGTRARNEPVQSQRVETTFISPTSTKGP